MKKFLSSAMTIMVSVITITIGIIVFSILLAQGLLYTFHINLSLYGICLLSSAIILGLSYLINMFKS